MIPILWNSFFESGVSFYFAEGFSTHQEIVSYVDILLERRKHEVLEGEGHEVHPEG